MSPGHQHDSLQVAMQAIALYLRRLYGPSVWAEQIELPLNTGKRVSIPMPPPWALFEAPELAPHPAGPGPATPAGVVAGDGFRSLNWWGRVFSFTKTQAAVLQALLEAADRGTPDVEDGTLLRRARCESTRLSEVFRDSPAWGTVIVEGGSRGTHRLADRDRPLPDEGAAVEANEE